MLGENTYLLLPDDGKQEVGECFDGGQLSDG